MNQWTEDPNDDWKPSNQTRELHLGDYALVLRSKWRSITVLCLLGVGLGLAHYFLTPRQYRAKTTIQIERRSLTSLTGDSNPWLESYWNMEFYPTQYRLLQSRGLAERVVANLDLARNPDFNPGYEPSDDPTENAQVSETTKGQLANRLLAGLEVNPIRNTQLVEITYRSSSAELASAVANGVSQAFIEWGIYKRSETAANASSFLTTQISDLSQSLEDKESELQSYSRTSDIVAIDPGTNDTLQRLEVLNRDYISATSDRITTEAFYQGLLNSDKKAVADSITGGLISQQLEEIGRLETTYNGKLKTFKPDWPEMVELRGQIEQRRLTLDETVNNMADQARAKSRSDYLTALRKEQSLERELDNLKGEAMELNSAAVEFNNLALEVQAKRDLLGELRKRQSETELASRMNTTRESNIRVIDRALVASRPFRPSLEKDITFGLGMGLLASIAIILLIEYTDRSLKTSDQLEKLLEIPTLAVIPDISERNSYGYGYGYGKRKDEDSQSQSNKLQAARDNGSRRIELLPIEQPKLAVSEAYRALRTALLLSTANELKVVTMTSANAGEGKTATSANLAIVMAQLGKRVLLIDGDLRKPRMHEVFSRSNLTGLVNCLADGGEPRSIFQKTDIPGLFLAPSGPIPPNPSELLASKRMRRLIEYCREHFDFVVIDTPPTLAVTDSTLLGSLADGVVLCLQAGRVLRQEAQSCLERLRLAEVRVLGTVLNRYRSGSKGNRGYVYYQAQSTKQGSVEETSDSAA